MELFCGRRARATHDGIFGLYVVDEEDQPRVGQRIEVDGAQCEVVMVAPLPGRAAGFQVRSAPNHASRGPIH